MDEVAFLDNHLVQDAVVRNLEIIGDASNNIGKHHPEFVVAHPELPLAVAYQMRNAVAHGYFEVDFEIVWKTIQRDLPKFYAVVRSASTLLASGVCDQTAFTDRIEESATSGVNDPCHQPDS